ncbi:Signal transduction histidine-protein kinase/phosphatase DegS [Aquisphaera giovannonii]|uniref:Oxygen sensor histidine kinase NreB n=1 Tax=Aquisphaera giovannonii TaxID=406548 RepID=A0A5B9W0I9_9BACT|nr:ATP-binding protein [Aquisphaera giovannonii]QEH33430.1 Signal transduction histidine-protein kinase/phosphatase DegS [Aquisphaera giovannonii]
MIPGAINSADWNARRRPLLVRYAAAVVFVALAVLARWLLEPILEDRQAFPTFYVSVTAAAWWGGLGPTFLALALGYLAGDWFFVRPQNTFSALNLANTGTYFFVGFAIAFFTQMLHAAQARAEANAAELRDRQGELEHEIAERRRVETEREHLFGELSTARGRLEAVLRQMPAGVVIAEAPSGRIVLANEQSRGIWGTLPQAGSEPPEWDPGRLKGKDGRGYLPHEWPLARSLHAGEVVKGEEILFPRDDGEWGTMTVSSVPIRDQAGGVVAAVAILDDITARKRAEEALLQAREELERRVAGRTADLARANESLRAEVAERRRAEQTRNELLRRLVAVQEEERVRIARELHDQMGQQLTALKLGLEALAASLPGEGGGHDRLSRLLKLTRQIGHDMHRIAWELGPAVLGELGLPEALSNYAEEWSGHSGVPVQVQATGPWESRLPSQVETSLYRVVQEALTNVAKYANASRVGLILNRNADDVLVIVEDDGVGFDAEHATDPAQPRRRLGLAGMKERVGSVGGALQIESIPGGGTTLFVRVPLRGRDGRPVHG